MVAYPQAVHKSVPGEAALRDKKSYKPPALKSLAPDEATDAQLSGVAGGACAAGEMAAVGTISCTGGDVADMNCYDGQAAAYTCSTGELTRSN